MKFQNTLLRVIPNPPLPVVTPRGLAFILCTVVLSVAWVVAMANYPHSAGWSAALLSIVQVLLLLAYIAITRDGGMLRLTVFGAVFGVVELLADALCVHFTGTLDYTLARSPMLWLSPWWMPLAWMIVAVQIGYLGAWIIGKAGLIRGTLLTALLGAINIPFYEEMAYHAHWWQYVRCQSVGHTPIYIIVAELIIGLALGPLAVFSLASPDIRRASWLGVWGGIATVIGGLVGYGLVEFLPTILRGGRLPLP